MMATVALSLIYVHVDPAQARWRATSIRSHIRTDQLMDAKASLGRSVSIDVTLVGVAMVDPVP